ncbi:MAG: ABC transporter permease [Thermomicrobiales bacterium]|nr:ABC transporter permease [Thermomicrobiales bacterium]MCO5220059.1 ABC transporter permease [Thermomicrobiales bacterium]
MSAITTAADEQIDYIPLTESDPGTRSRGKRRKRQIRLVLWGVPIIVFILIAIFGPMIVPYDSVTVRTGDRLKSPGTVLRDGSTAWLGTDQVGRDMLAQVLQGARISLLVGAATVVLAGLIGMFVGVIAGYRGGFLDSLLMRLADIQLAFPSIIFAIMIAAVIGPSVVNVIITLAITRWVVFARISRAAVLSVKEQEFVTAARAIGADAPRQLTRHIVPSIIAPLIVIATVEIGLVIIAEASLSFLGLGTPPSQPSWGQTIAQGRDYLNNAWWISTIPGIALCLVVISVGVFGDRLRDYLDPRMQKG